MARIGRSPLNNHSLLENYIVNEEGQISGGGIDGNATDQYSLERKGENGWNISFPGAFIKTVSSKNCMSPLYFYAPKSPQNNDVEREKIRTEPQISFL